jgi:polygalacturonase
MKFPFVFLLAVGTTQLLAQTNVQLPTIPASVFYVTNYSAVGDGVTTNTTAIQNAINAANAAGGGTVIVTPGNYLCGPLAMKNNLYFKIQTNATLTMLPIDKYPSGVTNPVSFLSASSLHDIQIGGGGGIEGQGLPWWQASETNSAANRPNMINLSACSKILIQDLSCSNSPSPFLVFKGNAGNITVQRVTIVAPSSAATPPSHNTDAIDLAETNTIIRDCYISTGDDNLAVGSSGSASHGILMSNCFLGDGHGVSIGSFTSGDVSNLTVINCNFNGTDNGIRLKSSRGRGGIIQNCNYYNLTMTNVGWPFFIYSYYELGLGTITGVTPLFAANYAATDTETNTTVDIPLWRNITFSNIVATTGTSTRPSLVVWGLTNSPATNIFFRNVTLISPSGKSPGIYSATNVQFIDCNWSLASSATNIQMWNAQVIISNSTPSASIIKLDGLTTNGYGNALKLYRATAALVDTNSFAGGAMTLSESVLNVTNHLAPTHATPFTFALGTNAATMNVRSNLVCDGTFTFTAGNGFTNGNYTLFSYGGSLALAAPTNTSAPTNYNYTFDTNTAGQVRLLVTQPAPPSFASLTLVGTQLVASGTSGYTNGSYNYYLITSTNLALPSSNWTRLATNSFAATGNFAFTNNISTNPPQKFFRVLLP